jgi:GNAT superfamily N-acetyltransferase
MTSLRIARANDLAAVRAFLTRLSPSTVKARYMSAWSSLAGPAGDREAQRLLHRDESRHVVLVAVDGGQIRGVGEFVAEPTSQEAQAELALVVEDAYQGRGIGRLLLRCLEDMARERGIRAFTGDVGYTNRRVHGLLQASGWPVDLQPAFGVLRFRLRLHGETHGGPATELACA